MTPDLQRLDPTALAEREQILDHEGLHPEVHVFGRDEILGVRAALATRRALLVRGPPGAGKSQLARAAAVLLERDFVVHSVDRGTQTRDLLFTVDMVSREALSQTLGRAGAHDLQIEESLALRHFTYPGALWWAFNRKDAQRYAGRSACKRFPHHGEEPLTSRGTVVLIDEIDKGAAHMPEGLLDAFENRSFAVPQGVAIDDDERPTSRVPRDPEQPAPLIVLTSNRDRALSAAFVRRCVVLDLNPPPLGAERDAQADAIFDDWLIRRGRAHFPHLESAHAPAARIVRDSRRAGAPAATSEYLDLLRAVDELLGPQASAEDAAALMEDFRELVVVKGRG